MRLICPLFVFAGCLVPASAQSGIGVPSLGFAFDPAMGAIRPILGIAGAAVLGSPADPGFELESAAISPRQDFALVTSAEDHGVSVIRLQDGVRPPVRLASAMSSPDQVVFSPSGFAAVLSRQAAGRLQVVTGLPGAPAIRELSMPALHAPAALAITDDASLLLVAGQAADPSWIVTADGSFIRLEVPEASAAFAFRAGSHDLLSATRGGSLYLARDVGTFSPFLPVDTQGAVAAEPIGVRFSSDGTQSYALGSDGSIVAVDLASGSSQVLSCGCRPTALEPLRSGAMFRITSISSRPLMLLDASSGLRMWFVPPDPQPADASQNATGVGRKGRNAAGSAFPARGSNQ